jgi:transposase
VTPNLPLLQRLPIFRNSIMPREATTTIQPSRPRTGRRASDEVAGATGLLEVQPEAVDVSQAFQAASLLNKASNTVRHRDEARPPRPADDTLKGTKYHRVRTNADPGSDEAQYLHRPQQQEPQKARASAIKENFRQIGSHPSVSGAIRFANDWGAAVAHSGLRPMITTAETVKRHLWSIAGFVTHPITNAATEGVNSMIQSLRHSARGLPNPASPRIHVLFQLSGLQRKPS